MAGIMLLASTILLSGACKRAGSNALSMAEVSKEQAIPEDSIRGVPPEPEVQKPRDPKAEYLSIPYWPSRERKWDLLHTKIEISFDWEKRQAPATATLKLAPYFYAQDSLVLDAVGFDIKSISLLQKGKNYKPQFTYDSTQLFIALDRKYQKGEEIQLRITYVAKPETVKEKGSAAITSDKGLYFINADGKDPEKPKQIWTQGETQASSHWFPTIDSPNERCTQETHITVDTAYTTLSNGTLTYSTLNRNGTRTDVWNMDKPHAPYLFMMAVGKFVITKDKWRNLDVHYYMEPKYAAKAKHIFGRTPQMMEFFSKKLGVDFPWPKYHQIVVRDFVSGAMENTSASLFYEAVQKEDKHLIDDSWDDIVAHELFHQWFGDLVTCESWPNLPLNESFATYGEMLWTEHQKGLDYMNAQKAEKQEEYIQEATTKRTHLIRYHLADKEEMFDRHSYNKGGLVLHMLRKTVGDEAFFAALKLYLTRHAYKSVEIHDLRLAFEEVTGQDLNWFFDQWFLSAGHPIVQVQNYMSDSLVTINAEQLQDTAATALFRLPVLVHMHMKDGSVVQKQITMTRKTQEWTFKVSSKPVAVVFNADDVLLGNIAQSHDEAGYLALLNPKVAFSHRKMAITRLKKSIKENAAVAAALETVVQTDPNHELRTQAMTALVTDSAMRIKYSPLLVARIAAETNNENRSQYLALLNAANAAEKAVLLQYLNSENLYLRYGASVAMLRTPSPEADALAKKLQQETDEDMMALVIEYTAEKAEPDGYDFLASKVEKLKGASAINGYGAFGAYLIKQPQHQNKGIKLLKEQLKNSQDLATRFACFRALTLFSDQPGILEHLQQALKDETNSTLKMYLQSLLGGAQD